jgi:hypothetical protein
VAIPLLNRSMRSVILALLVGATSAGCSTVYIPNTDVEDSTPNRKVIQFCEEYRHAMEEKNVGKLLAMAAPNYHSRGIGTHDYVDYDRLKETLLQDIPKTSAIRYEIKYQKVIYTESNHILVRYRFAASWKAAHPDGAPEWQHRVADNELDLVPEGEGYKIVAGM